MLDRKQLQGSEVGPLLWYQLCGVDAAAIALAAREFGLTSSCECPEFSNRPMILLIFASQRTIVTVEQSQ